jgi:hypothetical protein
MPPEVVSVRSLFGRIGTNQTHRVAAFATRGGESNRDRTATAR